MSKQHKLLLLLLFLLAAYPPVAFSAVDRHSFVLQLKWYHSFQFAGYYAAKDQGYYQQAGLDIEIREGYPGIDMIRELESGKADFITELPDALIARNHGMPIVALAAIFQHSPLILIALEDSGISTPADLAGKRIMFTSGIDAEFQAMLLNEGMTAEDITVLEHSWDTSDLLTGKADAMSGYSTGDILSLARQGVNVTTISPHTYGIDFYGDCLFTSEKVSEEYADEVQAFVEASLKGWQYAMTHQEQMATRIAADYATEKSQEFLVNEAKAMEQLMSPDLVEIGHMNPGRWKHIGDTYARLGMLSPDYSLDGFLYDPKNRQYTYAKPMFYATLILIFCSLATVFALILFNRKLRSEIAKQTEDLWKSEERYRELFENLIDVSYRTDSKGNFLLISPSAKETFGYAPEEVIGKQIANFYKMPERRQEFIEQLMRNGSVKDFEAEIRRKDGTFIWVSTNAQILRDENGNFIGVEGITRDISRLKKTMAEKHQLEENLRQSQKMEAVGTLAGGIAHDFNNILSAVLGYTDLAREQLPPDSPSRKHLDSVLTAAKRAKDLTRRILLFSRKRPTSKESVQLHRVIEESVTMLRRTLPANIRLETQIDTKTGRILADETELHQVVLNLCTNAYHAMEQHGGTIRIECKPIILDSRMSSRHPDLEPGDYALLRIADNGIGIPQEVMPRIFEPFFTTKERGKGTGMGLAMVHGIVKSHHGAIDVSSKPARGTIFNLYFPLSDQQENNTFARGRTTLPVGRERILLVDDEPPLVDLGKHILSRLGYDVYTALSALEALEIFQAKPDSFDLLITDQTMPDMTGDVLAQEVMTIRPDLPVIICTGHSSIIDAAKAREMGIKEFLMKPIERTTLAFAVRRAIGEPVDTTP